MKQTRLGRRIVSKAIDFGVLPCGYTPVDLDTFGMDNGGTKKELTVMQEMMFQAARMIAHAGRWVLGHGASDSGFAVFDRHYGQLKSAKRCSQQAPTK